MPGIIVRKSYVHLWLMITHTHPPVIVSLQTCPRTDAHYTKIETVHKLRLLHIHRNHPPIT